MGNKDVCRYLELVNRRSFIVLHSGIDWLPEYGHELESIDRELKELRVLVDQEHARREATMLKIVY